MQNFFILLLIIVFSAIPEVSFELLFLRYISKIFGNTVVAIGIAEAVFLLGFAIGTLWASKQKKYKYHYIPIVLFSLIIYNLLLVKAIIPVLDSISKSLFNPNSIPSFLLFQLLTNILILTPPFIAFGFLFIYYIRFIMVWQTVSATSTAYIYFLKNLMNVLGIILTVSVFIENLGVTNTFFLLNVFLVIALVLAILYRPAQNVFEVPIESSGPTKFSLLSLFTPLLYFLMGISTIGAQLLWSRLFIFSFHNSVYTMATVLVAVILGLSVGSLIAHSYLKRNINTTIILQFLLSTLALWIFISLYIIRDVGIGFYNIINTFHITDPILILLVKFLLTSVIVFIPFMISGAFYPTLVRYLMERSGVREEEASGILMASSSLGNSLGALIVPILFLPIFGIKNTFGLLLLPLFFFSLLFFLERKERKVAIGTVIVGVLAFILFLLRVDFFTGLYKRAEIEGELTYYKEGITGNVSVHQYQNYKILDIDGVNVAGTEYNLRTIQKLQAVIPLLFYQGEPRNILQVGFGSGETTRVLHNFTTNTVIDVVEISPEVVEAGEKYFYDINGGITKADRVNIYIMDAKAFIHLVNKKYDIIMNDSIHPKLVANAGLYTLDYFLDAKEKLDDEGVFSSWFPLFGLSAQSLKTIMTTFLQAFPNSYLWIPINAGITRHALLIGYKNPNKKPSWQKIQNSFKDFLIELKSVDLDNLFLFIQSLYLGGETLRKFVYTGNKAPLNTDENPVIEFTSAKEYGNDMAMWYTNYTIISFFKAPPVLCFENLPESAKDEMLKGFTDSRKYITMFIIDFLEPRRTKIIPLEVVIDYLDTEYFKNLGKKMLATWNQILLKQQRLFERGLLDVESSIDLLYRYLRAGCYNCAVQLAQELMKKYPNNISVLYNIAYLYDVYGVILKDMREFREVLEKLIALGVKEKEIMGKLSYIYIQEGKVKEAEDILDMMWKLYGNGEDRHKILYWKAVTKYMEGQKEEAVELLSKILEEDTNFQPAKDLLKQIGGGR